MTRLSFKTSAKIIEKTIIQDGRVRRFLGKLLRPLMKIGFSFIQNGLTPQAESVLMPWGLMRAASASDDNIRKKFYGPGMTTLVITNKETKYITKNVKFL